MVEDELARAIRGAEKAAQCGEAWEVVRHLFCPAVVSRVRGRLRRKWSWITDGQIDDATTEAYVALYQELRRGGRVRQPVAWLSTVAYRRAAEAMRKTERETPTDPSRLDELRPEPGDASLTAAAFDSFAVLIARLTPDGVRSVMEIVLESYRSGVHTLTDSQIADILDEHPGNVKKWRQRGFKKLARLAREEGLVDEDLQLTYLDFDTNEEIDE